jgi:hypothetical protein
MQMQLLADRSGFPMVWVEAIDAYLHWLPVTKLQFEYFLCDTNDPLFDADWYDQLLALNPRTAVPRIARDNYWQGLISGLMPAEAERFAAWCGERYSLPTLAEWQEAYRELQAKPPVASNEVAALAGLGGRGALLLSRVDTAVAEACAALERERRLADQMLMRLGVLEWVYETGSEHRWSAMGELPRAFRFLAASPDRGPVRPIQPTGVRAEMFGFRLVRRGRM